MRILKISLLVLGAALINSCGLDQMVKKYETTNFTTTPPVLQAHAGKVAISLDATFQPKYFAKKATVDFTPVLIYDGGETAFKSITVQGEDATGGEATIFHATGGSFKYQDAIEYFDDMMNAKLELRAVAKLKDKEKILGPINIAQGVIATSERVRNDEEIANNNHQYEHETILEKKATIYFLVNQSNIRTTEKSNDEIKELKVFAKNGYETHSIEIISYASPEGTVNTNDNVSDNRMKSTVNYTKRLLRSLRVDGARNSDLYTETSVGEDWEGFESLVEKSNIKDKRKINKLVNTISDVEEREQQIRDLAEIYDAIEDNVLPQLRKATIIIRSYEPKRTDEEIAELSTTNPEELDVKELLFSANLTNDENTKISIYKKAVELYNDWRGYNNIACIYLANGDLEKASSYLDKAEEIGANTMDDIWTNKGVIASRRGQLRKAQDFFDKAQTSEKNQAILNIRQAEYAKAARFYKGEKSYNAVLAQLLNGNNSVRCDQESYDAYYLNAIASARGGENEEAIMWLKKIPNNYRTEMTNDMEFINLKTNEEFMKLAETN